MNVWIDRTGTIASSLCAIHCCVMPFLLGALPLIGAGFLATNSFEWFMISIAAVLGSIGAYTGFRIHKNFTAILLLSFGLFMMVTNRVVHASSTGDACCNLHTASQDGIPWQVLPSVIGGVLVASSHVVNQHLCKECQFCDEEGCTSSVS